MNELAADAARRRQVRAAPARRRPARRRVSGANASISASSAQRAGAPSAGRGARGRVGAASVAAGAGADRRRRRAVARAPSARRRPRRPGAPRRGACGDAGAARRRPRAMGDERRASATHAAERRPAATGSRLGRSRRPWRRQAASARRIAAGHVDRDDARHALLLHRHADQLLGHLHRDLVVADEEELRALRHLGDELGSSARCWRRRAARRPRRAGRTAPG